MSDHNSNDNTDKDMPDDMTQKGGGKQGIDKAPGEETSRSNIQTVQQSQKGKNSVDGDLSRKSDRPLDEQIL